ncbi:flagellin [Andreprevotia lacus DSM 23236]|jgi:flagellin|uniref:Flagellin n=1 Tax=Andreprevotia lacus DSM 23236 TaxID=1121001 RepID=A0A1W1XLA7_9NEIS|nr:flagellin [Andreprevotia lacus]SMC24308.1 flagellin [Andreprevotia lacus DSM 23236]
MISSIGNNANTLSSVPANRNTDTLNRTLNQLSSGKRVNSAADDAAGSAIIQQFAAQIAGNGQAVRNLSDGISLTQVADGALSQLSDNAIDQRTLAVAAGNSTLSPEDRAALQAQSDALSQSSQDILKNTQFNGQQLLQGNGFTLQAGANANETIAIPGTSLNSLSSPSGTLDLSSPTSAGNAISALDNDVTSINSSRATLGAISNRLSASANNLLTSNENLSAAKSRIGDTDYASASSTLIQSQIRNQADLAVRAQANASAGQVLSLLR